MFQGFGERDTLMILGRGFRLRQALRNENRLAGIDPPSHSRFNLCGVKLSLVVNDAFEVFSELLPDPGRSVILLCVKFSGLLAQLFGAFNR